MRMHVRLAQWKNVRNMVTHSDTVGGFYTNEYTSTGEGESESIHCPT